MNILNEIIKNSQVIDEYKITYTFFADCDNNYLEFKIGLN